MGGRTNVRGRPAAYARTLARTRLTKALLQAGVSSAVVLAAALAAVRTYADLPAVEDPLVAAALFAALSWAVFRRVCGPWRQARAGINAEDRVAKRILRANPAAVVHGAVIGRGGDADHVVFGERTALVETKHARGTLALAGATGLVVGGKRLPRDPVAQASAQAQQVGRALRIKVTPIVCLVDMVGPPKVVAGVTCCSARDLPGVLHAQGVTGGGRPARARAAELWELHRRTR
jgi:hypothetical protein